MKKLILLLVVCTCAFAQVDARTRAYIHAMLADSAEVMRGTVSDTADVVRSTMRGEFEDSVDLVKRGIDSTWTYNKQLWMAGDTLFLTDGGADTNWIETEATCIKIGGDNPITLGKGTQFIGNPYPATDTLYYLGTSVYRWKEVWGFRHIGSDGTKADTFKLHDDGTNTKLEADNPIIIANTAIGDTAEVVRANAADSAAVYAGDSIDLCLRKDGSVALTADWAAGDFDITGLERLEADTVVATIVMESPKWLCGTAGVGGAGTIDGTQVTVPKTIMTDTLQALNIQNITTACVIDSFKLNGASDTLFFFVGGKTYSAAEAP